jgi:hypothetical protein
VPLKVYNNFIKMDKIRSFSKGGTIIERVLSTGKYGISMEKLDRILHQKINP